MKIICIVENLDKGAVENWLVRTFIKSKELRPGWDWTFYCILGKAGRLDEVVQNAGGKIIYSRVSISNKFSFLRHLRKTLKEGKFDILHAHHDYLSGFYLLASAGISFKKKIVHVHNTDRALPVGSRALERLLLKPFRTLALYFADLVVGISNETLRGFAGQREGEKYKVLYYGVDMGRFEISADIAAYRTELNLPNGSKLLLFAGRMNLFKNPVFVVDVLAELLKLCPDVYAIFAGTGEEEERVKERAAMLNVTSNIRMLGWREDGISLMQVSDVFVFPRLSFPPEGLGLVVIEAQAAGLPLLITDGIVPDAIVIRELTAILKLDDGAAAWAAKINEQFLQQPVLTKQEALTRMKNSEFELGKATRNFIALYE